MEETFSDSSSIQSANFNERWLQNIYENIKKIEECEILAYEGCTSLFDYIQLPIQQRSIIIADIQYKNLRFILTYMKTMLEDLVPILPEDKTERFEKAVTGMRIAINDRKRFVKEIRNAQNQIIKSETTPFFDDTLTFLSDLKKDVFKSIKHILYVQSNTPTW